MQTAPRIVVKQIMVSFKVGNQRITMLDIVEVTQHRLGRDYFAVGAKVPLQIPAVAALYSFPEHAVFWLLSVAGSAPKGMAFEHTVPCAPAITAEMDRLVYGLQAGEGQESKTK